MPDGSLFMGGAEAFAPAAPAAPVSRTTLFEKNDINCAENVGNSGWKRFEATLKSASGVEYETINIANVFENADRRAYDFYLDRVFARSDFEGLFRLDNRRGNGYSVDIDEYAVYSFVKDVRTVYTPLSSVEANNKSKMALGIYKAVLSIIQNYKQLSEINGEYFPLNCICEDSIYFHEEETGKYSLKILPVANKSNMSKRSVYVDLYDAAYLYFKLRYPDPSMYNSDVDAPSKVISRSLLPFEFLAPDLEYLCGVFLDKQSNSSSASAVEVEPDHNVTSNRIPVDKTEPSDPFKGVVDSAKKAINGIIDKVPAFKRKGKDEGSNKNGTIE